MQTVAMAIYGQDLTTAWEISTTVFGLLDEDEPLPARVAARAYTSGDLGRSWISQRTANNAAMWTCLPLAHHGNLGSRQILPRYRPVNETFLYQSANTTKCFQLVHDETRPRELLSQRQSLQKLSIGTKNLLYKSVRAE